MKNIEKPMPILLIEDNEVEVNEFKHYIEGRADAKLIKSTNSSYEGIEYTKMYMPEGIILDLELHKGEGSGISFLEELQKLKLDFKPLIVVTTNVSSKIIYRRIRDLGVDFIYYKKQSDYSPEMVINSMTSLRESLYSAKIEQLGSKATTETPMEHENRIREKITVELDLVGIPHHLVGRKYIEDFKEQNIIEKYGVMPKQLIEVKGLMGDSSDNIPGVPGIGEKTALELIKKYGSIENLYKQIEEGKDELKGKTREKIEQNKELAYLSKELGTINTQVPIEKNLEDYKITEWNKNEVLEIFKELKFNRFIERFGLKAEKKKK